MESMDTNTEKKVTATHDPEVYRFTYWKQKTVWRVLEKRIQLERENNAKEENAQNV
jgi:hypothetical protein